MSDDERLFEVALNKLDATAQAAAESALPPQASPALRSDVLLAETMRSVQVPADELRDARERVADLLRDEMTVSRADSTLPDGAPDATLPAMSPTPGRATGARPRRIRRRRCARAALAAAAILLIGCLAGWQVSDAAASALPGSPLYGLKRGEETLALDLAWSDQRQGEVLATIADHRLTELRAEAAQQNDRLVQSLAGEFDDSMRKLIRLAATMTARHENTTVVTSDLAHELTREYSTLRSAQQNGNAVLAQALTVTTQSETTAISNSHISLPPSATNTQAPGNGNGPPSATPTNGPPTTSAQGQGATHTPPAGSGNNNGNGNSSGNGNGGQGGGNPGSGSGGHCGNPGTAGYLPFQPSGTTCRNGRGGAA